LGNYKFPPSFIQELLSRVDIVDIVSHYLTLKQVGRNFTALCPFHPEKTPSFVVSPEKQIFKCFGCGVGGNAITFVEKYENLSFPEAVKRVAELSGIEFPTEFKEDDALSKIEEEGYKVAEYFHSKISQLKDYLQNRGIEESTASRFLLGYAPRGYSRELKVSRETARELGIISESGKEFFAERLIIPIFSHSGKVVAFAGRVLSNDSKLPKYINSPESSVFKKNSTLYGFYQSKEEILKTRTAVVVEGYFDVISLHQIGVKNAVAPMGTSITENHVRILSRYVEKPVLAFDGDSAGKKATLRAAGLFLVKGKEPFVAPIPEGEDPDSLSHSSPEKLKEIVNSPLPFIDWVIDSAVKLPDLEKSHFLREFANAIAPLRLANPFLYKIYVSKVSAQFDVDPAWFKVNAPNFRKKEDSEESVPVPPVEKAFIKGLVERKIEFPLEVSPNVFLSPLTAKIYTLLKNAGFSHLTVQSEFPELASVLSEILFSDFTDDEIKSAFCRIAVKELKRRLRKIEDVDEKRYLRQLIVELEKKNLDVLRELCDKTLI